MNDPNESASFLKPNLLCDSQKGNLCGGMSKHIWIARKVVRSSGISRIRIRVSNPKQLQSSNFDARCSYSFHLIPSIHRRLKA